MRYATLHYEDTYGQFVCQVYEPLDGTIHKRIHSRGFTPTGYHNGGEPVPPTSKLYAYAMSYGVKADQIDWIP